MQTWGFAISFATCQPGNRSECIHAGGATQPAAGLKPKASTQRYGTINATSVFWATVYKTVRRMLSYHCPVCLSVTFVYCGQTVRWIKTKLGMDYGGSPLSRPHCVRWGPSLPQTGAVPAIFGPCLFWPNGRPSQLLLTTCFTY